MVSESDTSATEQLALDVVERDPQDVGPCPKCTGRMHRLVVAPTRAVCVPGFAHNLDLETGEVFDIGGKA